MRNLLVGGLLGVLGSGVLIERFLFISLEQIE